MEVKPGYKQTEVGVIPADWRDEPLGKHVRITSGISPSLVQLTGGDYPYFKVEQLGNSNKYLGVHSTPYHFSVGRTVPKQSVIFAKRGAAIALNRVRSIVQDSFMDTNLMTLTPDDEIDGEYLFYALSHIGLWKLADTTSVPQINNKHINPLPFPIPGVHEQRAIATALSDVDALLEGLDRLIAKKRDLKQAAMQQLLTGETRLPGFKDEWRPLKFSDLTTPSHSRIDPSRSEPQDFCVELEHIEQGTGRLLGWSSTTSQSSLKARFEPGDVLFGKLRAYLRKYWLADRSGVCSTEIWVLTPNHGTVTSGYLYQLVTTDWFIEAASTAYGTHMPRSDWKVIRELELLVPSLAEQGAIAQTLGDMDAEIEALEQRRAKTADLKQAMMQELLTGKTRLVAPQVVSDQAESASSNAKGHNWAINEAVVIATLVKHFGKEDYPLGRKRYTKLSYLLHRHAERKAEGYLKKAAGPYNPKTKYGGPEKIAKQNGYIKQHKGPKGHSGFIAADNIAQAEGYFEKWYGPDAIQWLEQFRFKKNDDLEVLATVDMAAEELRASGKNVDVAAVKDVIGSHPEWEAKLDRAAFSDANIADAIKQSEALMGSEAAGGSHA